jgi:dihydropyrimidinase
LYKLNTPEAISYHSPLGGSQQKKISWEKVAEIASFNTAKIINLFPRKGKVQVGSDADLCIVDMNLSENVEARMLQSRSAFSLLEGWTLKAWPILTMVRGTIVMKDEEMVGQKGYGRFIET